MVHAARAQHMLHLGVLVHQVGQDRPGDPALRRRTIQRLKNRRGLHTGNVQALDQRLHLHNGRRHVDEIIHLRQRQPRRDTTPRLQHLRHHRQLLPGEAVTKQRLRDCTAEVHAQERKRLTEVADLVLQVFLLLVVDPARQETDLLVAHTVRDGQLVFRVLRIKRQGRQQLLTSTLNLVLVADRLQWHAQQNPQAVLAVPLKPDHLASVNSRLRQLLHAVHRGVAVGKLSAQLLHVPRRLHAVAVQDQLAGH